MNIYKLKKDGGNHIGKRFANGIWCWDCRIKAERDVMGLFWYCTKCGQRTSDKTLSNPAFRELGFDKSKETKKVGVNGAAGFIWHGKDKKDVTKLLKGVEILKTEYGDRWTIKRFFRMFNEVIEESYSDYDFS